MLASVQSERVKLIIDTDMSTDVDDVVALCIAHKLQDIGEAEIIAVVHNTGLAQGVGAISVINHFYGRDDIPIGAYKGLFDNPDLAAPGSWEHNSSSGPYVRELVSRLPSPIKNSSQVPNATKVYRSVLASQPDSSVVIASIGFLNNLAMLLDTVSDEDSSLSGRELVARKVKEVAIMGGTYPNSGKGHEWNFGGGCEWLSPNCSYTPGWTKSVIDKLPTSVQVVFSGFELGGQVVTGGTISSCAAADHPAKVAMELFHKWDPHCPPRESWDPVTTLYAVQGSSIYFSKHIGGRNIVNGSTGANHWVDGPSINQSYLSLRPQAKTRLEGFIDELLCSAPSEMFGYSLFTLLGL